MSTFTTMHEPFDYYEIDDTGVIREIKTEKVVVPHIDSSNAPRVALKSSHNDKTYVRSVSRFVLDMYGPHPLSRFDKVYYIDKKSSNVRAENLYSKPYSRPFVDLYPVVEKEEKITINSLVTSVDIKNTVLDILFNNFDRLITDISNTDRDTLKDDVISLIGVENNIRIILKVEKIKQEN